MTSSEILYQIILSLFSAIVGGWVGGYTQRYLDRKTRNINVREKQLMELYSPLNSSLEQIYTYLFNIFELIQCTCEYSNLNQIPENG